jgi:diguanylate cyclase (GGDEF)-like protein/PAS domain S-box-containing protein
LIIETDSSTNQRTAAYNYSRRRDQTLFNNVANTLMVMDLLYFTAIFLTSSDPWISLGLAVLIPAMNVFAVKYEARTGLVLITYTLPLSLIPMLLLTYISGVNSPAWFMAFGVITATNIIYPFKKMIIPLIIGFIGCALLGTWYAGGSFFHLAIIAIALVSISAVLNRVFVFLSSQMHRLRDEITEREQAVEALNLSEARYQAVVEGIDEVISRFTADGTLKFVNEAYCHLFGKNQQQLIGQSVYLHIPSKEIPVLKDYFASFMPVQPRSSIKNTVKNAAGDIRFFEWSNSATFDTDGNITEILSVGRDVTERYEAEKALKEKEKTLQHQVVELKYSEERLEAQAAELVTLAENLEAAKQEMQHLANHDSLTGLPSLRLCKDRLNTTLASDRRNDTRTAVLFIDRDGFKNVNDTLGHNAGDVVLKTVAQRPISSIRDVDTAARIGGDEFILVLPECANKEGAATVAQRIINIVSEPYSIDGEAVHIGASIGIAFSPTDGDTPDDLLRNADASMYVIKKQGKNNYGFFS